MSLIVQKVEHLFSAEYLFNPVKESWRCMVCPYEAEKVEELPWVGISLLLGFVEISALCSGDQDKLGEALEKSNSSVVAVKKQDVKDEVTGTPAGWVVRRKTLLNEDEDPERRTVFVKPIHFDATEDMLKDFFGAKFGPVEKVERREYLDGTISKPRPSVFLVFKTVLAANAAAKCKHLSYGSCGSELGDLFIPRISIVLKGAHDAQVAEEADRQFQQRQKEAAVKAAQGIAAPTGPRVGADGATTRFLKAGCTLKVTKVVPGTTWQEIKLQLGNLAAHFPETLKGQVGLVRVVANNVGYVIVKNAKAATDMQLAYDQVTGSAHPLSGCQKLTTLVPTLGLVSGLEEEQVQAEFPTWTSEKVQKKQKLNDKAAGGAHGAQKRNRDGESA